MTAMTSASIFGWISVDIETGCPRRSRPSTAGSGAKSGESTPIIFCIGLEVSPTL